MDDMQQIIVEERVTRPLFMERPNHQCCWPMWGEGVAIEDKRCCGALVPSGSKIPYCPDHLGRQVGERSGVRVIAKTTRNGAPT